jgi:hypothetical protein
VHNWVAALRRERAAPGGPVSVDQWVGIARLRRRAAELELEKEIPKEVVMPLLAAPGGDENRRWPGVARAGVGGR